MDFTGSPTKKRLIASFNIFDDGLGEEQKAGLKRSSSAMPLPLTASKLVNQLPCGSPKKSKLDHSPVDDLLARLNEQQAVLSRQKSEAENIFDDSSSSATNPYAGTPPLESDGRPDAAEVLRLKKELELARERMAQMDLQLAHQQHDRVAQNDFDAFTQSQIARHTVEQAIGSPFPAAQHLAMNMGPTYMSAAGPMPMRGADYGGDGAILEPAPMIPRPHSSFQYQQGYTPPMTPFGYPQAVGMQNAIPQRLPPRPRSRLSPVAQEFGFPQWGAQAAQQPTVTYMSTAEPLNYRRLLDRNMSCNWRYIVDKIVCNNDQQASIFLQQKLKVGTVEQKFEIVQAIIDQAYPLMVNRFGNFLVQRCFEHGTPEQVVSIAQAIRGNTLNLSMDAFGCHVVQKAFDSVPEEYKAIMVHELLRRIPETVIHRYACHVWQKLFELRWSDSPPQIMKYVNEALRGMWHEVALGETGSLVVQNIFENCLEEDKRPCINEVISSIDVVAHGQFGNWCIQHICEHGSIPDRSRAIDHVIRYADQYSMDQFASKVVEKCLKVSGNEFLDRYLDRVCEANPERPRMPLIDISGDQFGNYLIQYILTNADPQRREIVAAHIRKHMVSLRGSKYGSRVAMLCCNPAYATRPGPPTGLPPTRSNSRFSDYFGPEPPRSYSHERQYAGAGGRNGYAGGYR
ncbi:hypothetical protein LTR02_009506 [Friedmanniomyces endolithicus]|nr:hypothetical protein LTR94_010240 [Friedmanniomyces endolithicus]KAK0788423.1 hypothetical protein LTR38_011305 [Friedmanniomyces endolithicus]KAK0839807.1 hypothetical protein LTR03_010996 [Friedmanniomyces endolithicus]KAK0849308.1 hypothetical protein LTS02_013649 [Friedmanniomyces endolithicus]KAK0899756.1 hypothetical protein LTR02_009506 [Friedmanniomyces endolithicus]